MNLDRLRTLMAGSILDVLVATAPPNVAYLTGYRCWCESQLRGWMVQPGGGEDPVLQSAAIVTADGRVTLVAGVGFALNALDARNSVELCLYGVASHEETETVWSLPDVLCTIRDAHVGASSDFPTAIVTALHRVGAANGRVGIDGSNTSAELWGALRAALPAAELRDCRQLLRLARAVKTPIELELLARSAEVNESALLAALSSRPENESLASLSIRYRTAVAEGGADFDHLTPAVGGLGFTEAGRVELPVGEVLAVDSGCSVEGYFSDTQVTTCADEVPDRLAARYEALRSSVIDVGGAALRPGVRASQPYEAIAAALHESRAGGLAGGHGLGLELRDLPIIAPASGRAIRDDCVEVDSDLTLEAGMVVNVEATALILGEASLGCEVSYVITEDGARPLTSQHRDGIVIASDSGSRGRLRE